MSTSHISKQLEFIGRQREMNDLRAALEDVKSGNGRLMMVTGAPGIGKSRTAQEVAQQAEECGFQTFWGRCYEAQGAPPYWPWIRILRAYVEQCDAEQLRLLMGAAAADIAEIVPELRERLPDLKPPTPLEPEQARFRLFDSITAFLKRSAQLKPTLLVLDDIHQADRPSMLLVEFLAREMAASRIFLLGTYRDTDLTRRHPLTRTLGELAREPVFDRIVLQGFSEDEVAQVIKSYSGSDYDEGMARAVHTKTEGNPLFVTEVVWLLNHEGRLHAANASHRFLAAEEETWKITIPLGVQEAISSRLNRLSERCHEALVLASVIGREFDLDLLRLLLADVITELSANELLVVLEEAIETRVIEEQPSAIGRFQFAHVLIRDTLAGELSATRQASLQGHIGDLLEKTYGDVAASHAAELSYYYAQATPLVGTEKLVKYSLLAGEQALATYAYEESLEHFQRALAVKEGQPIDDETAELLFGLGRAQAALLQLEEATDSLSRAFDYYAQAGDIPRALDVAEHPLPAYAGQLNWASQISARALELVPPDSHEAGRLLSNYVRLVGFQEADYEVTMKAFDRALSIAQREKDEAMEMRTLANGALVDVYHWRFQEGLEKSRRAIEMARYVDDPQSEAVAHYTTAIFLFLMGDSEGARHHAASGLIPAEKVRDRSLLSRVLWASQIVPRLQGDWATARDFSDRALLTVWPRDPRTLFARAALEYEVGEIGLGEAYLERLLETMRLISPGPNIEHSMSAITIPAVARISGVFDYIDVAQEAAQTVLSSPAATPLMTLLSRMGLALLAVHRGDAAAAREQYAALEPMEPFKQTMPWLISGDRLLGILAQTMGDLGKAAGHFEDALAFCRKAGYLPELAWTCYDYAAILVGPYGRSLMPNARQKALSLLDDAVAITLELGMGPLMEKVVALKESIGGTRRGAPSYPDRLTPREVEVLRLIAVGKTNQEIADELFISPKTVTNHVTSILNKTGGTNRAQATSYAHTHGLI